MRHRYLRDLTSLIREEVREYLDEPVKDIKRRYSIAWFCYLKDSHDWNSKEFDYWKNMEGERRGWVMRTSNIWAGPSDCIQCDRKEDHWHRIHLSFCNRCGVFKYSWYWLHWTMRPVVVDPPISPESYLQDLDFMMVDDLEDDDGIESQSQEDT